MEHKNKTLRPPTEANHKRKKKHTHSGVCRLFVFVFFLFFKKPANLMSNGRFLVCDPTSRQFTNLQHLVQYMITTCQLPPLGSAPHPAPMTTARFSSTNHKSQSSKQTQCIQTKKDQNQN
jgi:hypothetical protein